MRHGERTRKTWRDSAQKRTGPARRPREGPIRDTGRERVSE